MTARAVRQLGQMRSGELVRRLAAERPLAAKLKRSNSYVRKIEAGERRIYLLRFIEIARCLN